MSKRGACYCSYGGMSEQASGACLGVAPGVATWAPLGKDTKAAGGVYGGVGTRCGRRFDDGGACVAWTT